jgi:hypothetical protein
MCCVLLAVWPIANISPALRIFSLFLGPLSASYCIRAFFFRFSSSPAHLCAAPRLCVIFFFPFPSLFLDFEL